MIIIENNNNNNINSNNKIEQEEPIIIIKRISLYVGKNQIDLFYNKENHCISSIIQM